MERLFLSVNWSSGHFPDKLVVAMQNYGTVFSAWDNNVLVGLICAMDDGIMNAYVHYLLVDPAFQGRGIGRELVDMVKESMKAFVVSECNDVEAIRESFIEYSRIKGAESCFVSFEDERNNLESYYFGGALLVGCENDTPVGCIAIRKVDEKPARLRDCSSNRRIAEKDIPGDCLNQCFQKRVRWGLRPYS